jgi:hypothetical protein
MRGTARGKGRPPLHSRRLLVPLTAVSPAAFNPGARIAGGMRTQSRQIAKLFSSCRNWDSPNPSPAGECAPPFGSGRRGTLAGERGGGRVPIPTSEHTLWYSAKMRSLLIEQLFAKKVQIKSQRSYPKEFPSNTVV